MSDLLQVMPSGRPVWCRRLAERGMHPSASLIEAWKSGHDGFGGSLKSLVVSAEVAGFSHSRNTGSGASSGSGGSGGISE